MQINLSLFIFSLGLWCFLAFPLLFIIDSFNEVNINLFPYDFWVLSFSLKGFLHSQVIFPSLLEFHLSLQSLLPGCYTLLFHCLLSDS